MPSTPSLKMAAVLNKPYSVGESPLTFRGLADSDERLLRAIRETTGFAYRMTVLKHRRFGIPRVPVVDIAVDDLTISTVTSTVYETGEGVMNFIGMLASDFANLPLSESEIVGRNHLKDPSSRPSSVKLQQDGQTQHIIETRIGLGLLFWPIANSATVAASACGNNAENGSSQPAAGRLAELGAIQSVGKDGGERGDPDRSPPEKKRKA